jgi:prepilin-type processing-associated H-X9-DG protein
LYRHGLQFGSNLLYLDGHVDPQRPEGKPGALDPWQVVVEPKTTPPTP